MTRASTDLPPLVRVAPPGPKSSELALRALALECPAFAERRKRRQTESETNALPIVLARGAGSNIWDADENRYVDLAAGFGAAILGHGPSAAHDAARAQVDVLAQGLGDLYPSDVKVTLLDRLSALLPARNGGAPARVMLGQLGADAVTIALKSAVLATGRSGLLAFQGAYHGLSYAPLAACGFRASFREPFADQQGSHVRFVPYPSPENERASLEEAEQALRTGAIGAIIIEPILGRGGVVVPRTEALVALVKLAHENGALFIADEIWTGMGRSGALLRSTALGLDVDLVCVGKGLGASFPVSACIGKDDVMQAWARGGEVVHTSTHAGAPLACAAAVATLQAIEELELTKRAERLGAALRSALAEVGDPVVAVRGEGLIVGIEWKTPEIGLRAWAALLRDGYLVTVGGAAGEVTVLTPALTIDETVLFGVVKAIRRIAAVLGATKIAGATT